MRWRASGASKAVFETSGQSLRLEGMVVDRVAAVGTVLMVDRTPETCSRHVRIPKVAHVLADWRSTADATGGSRQSISDAFIQAITTESSTESIETLREQLGILERYSTITRFNNFFLRFLPAIISGPLLWALQGVVFLGRRKEMTLNFRISLSSLGDRRLVRTEGGHLGLASALAQPGDGVALAKGAKVPLTLRPQGAQWLLGGDCYVGGMMNGEKFEGDQCGAIWLA